MEKIHHFIKTPTTKHIAINTLGNYLNVFFTIVYTLALVRSFDREQYGVFSVLVALGAVLANILDFGVTASIFSELPAIREKHEKTLVFLKTNILFQSVLAFLTLALAFFFTPVIDKSILKLSVSTTTYGLTFLSVPLLIWQNTALNTLYATNNFLKANIYINAANIIKTGSLFLFIFQGDINVNTAILALFIIGPAIFILFVIIGNKAVFSQLFQARLDRRGVKLSYSLTYFVATQLFNLASRVDLFSLAFFLPKSQVGLYAPAQKIVLTILTAVNSITQVLSPQFAAIKTKKETLSLLKKGFAYMSVPVMLYFGVVITPFFAFELFFTKTFAETADIARALSGGYILFSLSAVPLLFFLYTIKKPVHLLLVNLLFLIGIVTGCFLFIPKFALFGPPIAFGLTSVLIVIYIATAFIYQWNKMVE